jgi:hypothetical protein
MSQDIPSAAELLTLAREAFLDSIVGHLPVESRYLALMIANAMAIAAREIEQGPEAAAAERKAILGLLPGASAEAQLADLRRELAAGIRNGFFDHEAQRLIAALGTITRARLAISNPKALPTNR